MGCHFLLQVFFLVNRYTEKKEGREGESKERIGKEDKEKKEKSDRLFKELVCLWIRKMLRFSESQFLWG